MNTPDVRSSLTGTSASRVYSQKGHAALPNHITIPNNLCCTSPAQQQPITCQWFDLSCGSESRSSPAARSAIAREPSRVTQKSWVWLGTMCACPARVCIAHSFDTMKPIAWAVYTTSASPHTIVCIHDSLTGQMRTLPMMQRVLMCNTDGIHVCIYAHRALTP